MLLWRLQNVNEMLMFELYLQITIQFITFEPTKKQSRPAINGLYASLEVHSLTSGCAAIIASTLEEC